MKETRTWEQMRADNDGAAWIEDDGTFCSQYTRTSDVEEVRRILAGSACPEWAKPGFNGCWSCDNTLTCERYQSRSRTPADQKL